MALKYIHDRNIIHGDIKLSNILVDDQGHIKLADFGLSAIMEDNRVKKVYHCTYCYMAPERINGRNYPLEGEYWSFGVSMYQMLLGRMPFSGLKPDELFKSIKESPLSIPEDVLTPWAMDILTKLLIKDPNYRLGHKGGIREIQGHPFFAGVKWDEVQRQESPTPIIFMSQEISTDQPMEYLQANEPTVPMLLGN